MATDPTTQFYKSWIKIGGIFYPAVPGSVRYVAPRNWIIPPVLGNYWQWNFAEGLRQPVFEAQIMVQDDSAASVLSTAFLNLFLARSNDIAHDTTAISGGVQMFNGRRGMKMVNGVKAESLTIGGSKSEPLRVTVRFVGTDVTRFDGTDLTAALTAFTAGGGWSRKCWITGKHINFGGTLADKVWNFNLSYANNHSPNMSMDGTNNPAAQNAGMQTAGMSFQTQAATLPDAILPNGNMACPPPATPSTIAVNIAGAEVARTLTLVNPILTNDDDVTISAPRNMAEYNVIALGGDGIASRPLVVS